MTQTAQGHFMQYKYWKQDDYKKEYYNVSRECQRLQDKRMAETKQLYTPIHPGKQRRQDPNQQFEGSEENDDVVDRRTGWKL